MLKQAKRNPFQFILLMLLLLLQTSHALAGKIYFEHLEPGQCQALPETKSYLTDPTSTIAITYQCQYRCADMDGKHHTLILKHEYKPNPSDDEMSSMVCHGIRIDLKKSELGYVLDQDIYVSNFWAILSDDQALKKWTLVNNISLTQESKKQMRKTMNETFVKMAVQTLPQATQSKDLQSYAVKLLEIGTETAEGNALLSELIEKIKRNEKTSNTVENLLILQIKFHGKFLLI